MSAHPPSKPITTTLNILVPKPNTRPADMIRRGSAIVSDPENNADQITVYYEGNVFDASNLTTFEERLTVAANRLVHSYPTIARATVDRDAFSLIGTARHIPGAGWIVVNLSDPVTLAEWLAPETLPALNGSRAFRERLAAHAVKSMRADQLSLLAIKAQQTESVQDLVDLIVDPILLPW